MPCPPHEVYRAAQSARGSSPTSGSGRSRGELSHGSVLRRHRHRGRHLGHVPAPPAARAGPARAGLRGRRRRRGHLVLEPLSRRPLRLRVMDLRLLLLGRDPARVGVERALRGPAGDATLLQLRGGQARPPPRHRVRLPHQGRGLRRGGRRVGDRERGRPARARPVPDHRDRAPVGADHADHPGRRQLPRGGLPHRPVAARAGSTPPASTLSPVRSTASTSAGGAVGGYGRSGRKARGRTWGCRSRAFRTCSRWSGRTTRPPSATSRAASSRTWTG
jgi:hypothetical protein